MEPANTKTINGEQEKHKETNQTKRQTYGIQTNGVQTNVIRDTDQRDAETKRKKETKEAIAKERTGIG